MLSFVDPAIERSEADAYLSAAGHAAWTGTDALKDAAIIRGQRYVASTYNRMWCVAFENDAAPHAVKYAIAEAALLELQTPGFFSKTYTEAERKVLVGVASIRWEVVGDRSGELAEVPRSTIIDGLLSGLLCRPLSAIVVV